MSRRSVVRSVLRIILATAALSGFMAGALPGTAAAEPASDPGPLESLDSTPSVALDQYPPPSARTNLLIAGAASTAGWYGLALGSALIWPNTVGANDLRIPVAGPWMAVSHSGCGNVSDCSKVIVVLRAIATMIDGIGQAGGLAIAAEGLFLPTREPARKQRERNALKQSRVELHPSFDAGKNSIGFGVLGVF